jgi:hypothetical protein
MGRGRDLRNERRNETQWGGDNPRPKLALSGGTRRSRQRYGMKIEFEDKFQGILVSPEILATERGALAASLSPRGIVLWRSCVTAAHSAQV